MTKAQDNAKRQRGVLQKQVAALNTEIEETKVKMEAANNALTKEQLQRLDENRRQQQAQSAYMAAGQQQMWAVDPRVAAVVNPRTASSQLPRSLTPHGRSLSPQPMGALMRGGAMAPGAQPPPVGSAVAARSQA